MTSNIARHTAAWNGVLFDKFARFRDVLTRGFTRHGDAALQRHPAARGAQVLDVGCGFGDVTSALARDTGYGGMVSGVDVAQRFVDAARADAERAGLTNTRFFRADVQTDDVGGPYDMIFSRFGTMFFANPVAAMRNLRASLKPVEQLLSVVQPDALKIALVLALALFVGLEREEHKQRELTYAFGGVTTFPVIGLVSYSLALLSAPGMTPWVVGLASVSSFMLLSYRHKLAGESPAGVITEMSALATYVLPRSFSASTIGSPRRSACSRCCSWSSKRASTDSRVWSLRTRS